MKNTIQHKRVNNPAFLLILPQKLIAGVIEVMVETIASRPNTSIGRCRGESMMLFQLQVIELVLCLLLSQLARKNPAIVITRN